MWLSICLGFLLASAKLNCGLCDDIEWLTTLLPEESDAGDGEVSIVSLEDEGYSTEVPENPEDGSKTAYVWEDNDPLRLSTATSGYPSEEDLKIISSIQYVPYPKELYPYFRTAFRELVASEELMVKFFEFMSSPLAGRRQSIHEMFDKRIREWFYTQGSDGESTGTAKDFVYSTVEPGYQYVEADSSRIARSGLLGEEESAAVPTVPDCGSDCTEAPDASQILGIPGEHFPDYRDIPETSFSCDGKRTPGFYADLETGCQVFHVCWPHRTETFLCPVGTTFNQAMLSCDYWFISNCSRAPLFFGAQPTPGDETSTDSTVDPLSAFPTEESSGDAPKATEPSSEPLTQSYVEYESSTADSKTPERELTVHDWLLITTFLPVKSKITIYPGYQQSNDEAQPESIFEWVLKEKASVGRENNARKLRLASQVLKETTDKLAPSQIPLYKWQRDILPLTKKALLQNFSRMVKSMNI